MSSTLSPAAVFVAEHRDALDLVLLGKAEGIQRLRASEELRPRYSGRILGAAYVLNDGTLFVEGRIQPGDLPEFLAWIDHVYRGPLRRPWWRALLDRVRSAA